MGRGLVIVVGPDEIDAGGQAIGVPVGGLGERKEAAPIRASHVFSQHSALSAE
jgi:hypothetical protein